MDYLFCPFCGGPAKAFISDGVTCTNEKCRISHHLLPPETWNSRPELDALKKKVIKAFNSNLALVAYTSHDGLMRIFEMSWQEAITKGV